MGIPGNGRYLQFRFLKWPLKEDDRLTVAFWCRSSSRKFDGTIGGIDLNRPEKGHESSVISIFHVP